VPGSVHQGFSHDCDELWSWVLGQVLGLPTTKPLYVTGHSKGGALADIAAVKFVAAGLTPFVCTFEGARAGDQAFVDGYAKLVNHSTRYEYQDDIVPHLPPDLGFQAAFRNVPELNSIISSLVSTYVPVGDLRFVNWQNQIVPDNPALESLRYSHLISLMTMGGWDKIIDDHAIGPGSGAAAAICGPIWPPPIAPAPVILPSLAPTSDVPF
jgi:Lipase (class 3)